MKLFPWPFRTDEIWTLIATQTPERLISSIDIRKRSHWRFNAIFSHGHSGKTKFVTICFPWALFSLMRCGDQYRDGQRLPHSSIGTQESLDLAGLTQPTLERMNHSLPPHFKNYIGNHSTFSEFMFVWKDGKRQILLPVLEMLRAVFVKNNTFALGILDPIFLSSVGQWNIKDRILSIEFRDKFPLPLRRSDRNSVLRVLAYLFCNSSFFAAFQQIAQNRILKPSEALHTISPALYPKVLCQTYTDKTITFIWSIDRVAAAAPLDIDAIHFRHPKHGRSFPLKTEKQQGNQQKPGGIPIVNITSPPTIPRSSALPIQGLPSSLFDDLRLKIKNVGEMQHSKAKIISTAEYDEQSPNVSFGHPQQGSTHLNAYIEIVEAAPPVGDERLSRDFRWQRSQTDGFETLREALKEIQKIEPTCTVRWYRGPSMIRDRAKPVMRPYAVIHLRSKTFNAWLIEFLEAKQKLTSNNELLTAVSQKNQRMSTMIINNIPVAASLDDIALFIQEIILNGLTSGYHWGVKAIETYNAIQNFDIKLLKHTKGDASHWAQRIFKSVSPTS